MERDFGEMWGETVAAQYDMTLGEWGTPERVNATAATLAEIADDGAALEFAIGTGRIGLPLAALGVPVSGIEMSTAMAAQLASKPGGEAVHVTIGDMANSRVDGEFSLVYLVFNTITNLLTQDEQVACFENAAAHLAPGGSFVVEVQVPRLRMLPLGQRLIPFDVSPTHIGIDEYDVVEQILVSNHVYEIDGRQQRWSSPHRYAWPAEYDLMARIAGLELAHRWSDWDRSPFTEASDAHVSVWTLPTRSSAGHRVPDTG